MEISIVPVVDDQELFEALKRAGKQAFESSPFRSFEACLRTGISLNFVVRAVKTLPAAQT
jgi:hypothetical protein